jgi:hypothetical protein
MDTPMDQKDEAQSETRDDAMPASPPLFAFDAIKMERKEAATPLFKKLDIDTIHYHHGLAAAYRAIALNFPENSKSGLLNESGLRTAAYALPIRVVAINGHYYAFAGIPILELARSTLRESRYFPVLVHRVATEEDILDQAVIERIVMYAMFQIPAKKRPRFVDLTYRTVQKFAGIFNVITQDHWAKLCGITDRTVRNGRRRK